MSGVPSTTTDCCQSWQMLISLMILVNKAYPSLILQTSKHWTVTFKLICWAFKFCCLKSERLGDDISYWLELQVGGRYIKVKGLQCYLGTLERHWKCEEGGHAKRTPSQTKWQCHMGETWCWLWLCASSSPEIWATSDMTWICTCTDDSIFVKLFQQILEFISPLYWMKPIIVYDFEAVTMSPLLPIMRETLCCIIVF